VKHRGARLRMGVGLPRRRGGQTLLFISAERAGCEWWKRVVFALSGAQIQLLSGWKGVFFVWARAVTANVCFS
jgi:hypothetical protein